MATSSNNSPNFRETHFVDIHEVLHEEEEEEAENITGTADKAKNRFNPRVKITEGKRPRRSLSRQVSLETGFSVLHGESKIKGGQKFLARSGKSFGDYGSARRVVEGRKGDFSIFRTKSALSRQNSVLPPKESGLSDHIQRNDAPGELDDSVPAGRYFAALTGPELDQVKVLLLIQLISSENSA